MSSGDKEKQQRTMVVQGDTEPSAGIIPTARIPTQEGAGGGNDEEIVEGPGAGTSHALYKGDNAIGRGIRNRVVLGFGDETMHRDGHAWISATDGKFSIELGSLESRLCQRRESGRPSCRRAGRPDQDRRHDAPA